MIGLIVLIPIAILFLATLEIYGLLNNAADLSNDAALLILVTYNLAYALPFAIVPLLVLAMGDRAKPFLQKINDKLVNGADMLMPWLMLLLGLWLTVDSVKFFITGEPF